jgi:type II secretory pathway pseudopilin PulG
MRLKRHARNRAKTGFTLAEVLAALAFLAIVIPVAVEGLHTASLAGEMALRKPRATRIAQRVLDEALVTGQNQGSGASGVVEEENQTYRYSVRTQSWTEDAMNLVTVEVGYTIKGREYQVRLSTLTSR